MILDRPGASKIKAGTNTAKSPLRLEVGQGHPALLLSKLLTLLRFIFPPLHPPGIVVLIISQE